MTYIQTFAQLMVMKWYLSNRTSPPIPEDLPPPPER